jgi:predicted HicB family RNase H-like nuclease
MTNGRKYKVGPDVDLNEEVVLDSLGGRITETRAKEMAEYALEQARRGRPSLTGRGKRSPQVSFRVPEELARRAGQLARQQGKTLSELGREALEQYVEDSA